MSDNYKPSQEERNMAMLCHLGAFSGFIIPFTGIIAPLVIWILKKEESEFIDYHGKESLNFQVTMLITAAISAALIIAVIGIPLLAACVIAACIIFEIVMLIIASAKTKDSEYYRYPFCLRLIN